MESKQWHAHKPRVSNIVGLYSATALVLLRCVLLPTPAAGSRLRSEKRPRIFALKDGPSGGTTFRCCFAFWGARGGTLFVVVPAAANYIILLPSCILATFVYRLAVASSTYKQRVIRTLRQLYKLRRLLRCEHILSSRLLCFFVIWFRDSSFVVVERYMMQNWNKL